VNQFSTPFRSQEADRMLSNVALKVPSRLNQLRKPIAHTLSMDKIDEKMAQLKENYLASLTEKQAAGLKDQPDDFIAQSACVTCAGFIVTLQSRVGGDKSAEAAQV
jgi:hypothetical protein